MQLCNKCKTVEMQYVGETKPRSIASKGVFIEPLTGKLKGKPKWRCPVCGYTRIGRGESAASLKEKLERNKSF